MEIARKSYPSDVSDDEWALIAPYLTLLPEDAGQRDYPLREAFNGLRYIIKTGAQWRAMPHDLSFPPKRGGVRSEHHAAAHMAIPSMLARASTGVL
jgi:transposase